jgi:branched-chain amino acid transport system substrate-binding protein
MKAYGELLYPLVSAQGYDGTLLLLRAISEAGSTDGTKIAEALEKINGFKGTTTIDAAPFTHADHEGLDKVSQFFMATWKDGQVIKIDK